MQHQHRPAHLAPMKNRRTHQRYRDRAAIHALNLPGVRVTVTQLAAENMVNQFETGILVILVEQLEERLKAYALCLFVLPLGQFFGRRVHVGNSTAVVGGDDPVTNGLKRDLRPFFFQLQGLSKCTTLRQNFVRTLEHQKDQPQRRGQVDDDQQLPDKARALTQGITEGFGRRRNAFIDCIDSVLPAPGVSSTALTGKYGLVQLLRQSIELHQVGITDRPLLNGRGHIAEMTEVAIEPNDAGHIFRAVAALQNAFASGYLVWRGLVHRKP